MYEGKNGVWIVVKATAIYESWSRETVEEVKGDGKALYLRSERDIMLRGATVIETSEVPKFTSNLGHLRNHYTTECNVVLSYLVWRWKPRQFRQKSLVRFDRRSWPKTHLIHFHSGKSSVCEEILSIVNSQDNWMQHLIWDKRRSRETHGWMLQMTNIFELLIPIGTFSRDELRVLPVCDDHAWAGRTGTAIISSTVQGWFLSIIDNNNDAFMNASLCHSWSKALTATDLPAKKTVKATPAFPWVNLWAIQGRNCQPQREKLVCEWQNPCPKTPKTEADSPHGTDKLPRK